MAKRQSSDDGDNRNRPIQWRQIDTEPVKRALDYGLSRDATLSTLESVVQFLEACLANPYNDFQIILPAVPADDASPPHPAIRPAGSPEEAISLMAPSTALVNRCIMLAKRLRDSLAAKRKPSTQSAINDAMQLCLFLPEVINWFDGTIRQDVYAKQKARHRRETARENARKKSDLEDAEWLKVVQSIQARTKSGAKILEACRVISLELSRGDFSGVSRQVEITADGVRKQWYKRSRAIH